MKIQMLIGHFTGILFLLRFFNSSAQTTDTLIDASDFSGESSRGCLECSEKSVEYRLMQSDIKAVMAYYQLSEASSVLSVQIGRQNNSECQAQVHPRKGSPHLYKISVDYTLCDIKKQDTDTLRTYNGDIIVTIAVPGTNSMGPYERKMRIPFSCFAEFKQEYTTTAEYLNTVTDLAPIESEFPIGITSTSTSSLESSFLAIAVETQIITLKFSVDQSIRDEFNLLADRCWVTPTPNKNDRTNFTFVVSRGCNAFPNLVIHKSTRSSEVIYETASIQFVGNPSNELYYHCELNLCPVSGNQDNCLMHCPTVRAKATDSNSNPNKYTRNAAILVRSKTAVIIGEDGIPILPDPEETTPTKRTMDDDTVSAFIATGTLTGLITLANSVVLGYLYFTRASKRKTMV